MYIDMSFRCGQDTTVTAPRLERQLESHGLLSVKEPCVHGLERKVAGNLMVSHSSLAMMDSLRSSVGWVHGLLRLLLMSSFYRNSAVRLRIRLC